MYIANQNFKMGGQMVRRNDKIENIEQVYVQRGLVREVKIVQPSEVKDVTEQPIIKRRGRKPKAQTEQIKQSDD